MSDKVLFAWSGGKDSAMALYELKKMRGYEISALLTTITEDCGRISMHGVRRDLLERQAESLGLRSEKVYISKRSSNEEYESKMEAALARCQENGISCVAFGDIHLEDLRKYRESNLARANMKAVFPIWKRDPAELANTFIGLGFKAIITCVDSKALGRTFVGRIFDKEFLSELPHGVDPCGENGEFHSFVYDGPIFSEPILYNKGEVILRDGRYYFCDLIPAKQAAGV